MKKRLSIFLFFTISAFAQQHPSIIFLSDTQQPMWIETLRLTEHENEKATKTIFRAIQCESTAVGIFHLGDVTSIGMTDSNWKLFDEFHKDLHVPVYPVIGNHDYYLFQEQALEQFKKRFPKIPTTWYSVVIKSVGVIVLNSNFPKLSDDEHNQQLQWYHEQLARFEYDSIITSVIVLCHHSPYTNSTIVYPSQDVQQKFLVPFFMYNKTSVFMSGHAHAYEHFQKMGKELFVIGGGGGLLHPLLTGKRQRFPDLFSQQSTMRFFHYIECSIQPHLLLFSVRKLRNDFSGFDTVDSISVKFKQ